MKNEVKNITKTNLENLSKTQNNPEFQDSLQNSSEFISATSSSESEKNNNSSQENGISQNPKISDSKPQPKLDPTHFGDWQVNCRTIDF